MRRHAAVLLCLAPSLGLSYGLPRESAVPGGVKIIRLDIHSDSMPYVEVDGHRAMVIQDGADWLAIIGIPLSAPLAPRLLADAYRGQPRVTAAIVDRRRTTAACTSTVAQTIR